MAYSNDPLNEEEKSILREYICTGNRLGFRAVTPSLLESVAKKTPAEVREMIASFKSTKAKVLQDNIAKLQNDLLKYNG